MAAGPMNRLRLFKDIPRYFDAWDIDACYRDMELDGVRDAGIGLAGLRQIQTGGRLHIRQQILAFISRDILIHAPQLPLNHTQTIIDKHGGTDGDLVLVFYPILIIDGYQGIQYVFRTPHTDILNREVDHR